VKLRLCGRVPCPSSLHRAILLLVDARKTHGKEGLLGSSSPERKSRAEDPAFTRAVGNSLLNSLLKVRHTSCSSYDSVFKRFGSQTENSLLFPVPEAKIAEFGQKSGIFCRKEEKSLLISLFLGNLASAMGFQPSNGEPGRHGARVPGSMNGDANRKRFSRTDRRAVAGHRALWDLHAVGAKPGLRLVKIPVCSSQSRSE
jgi:hypothetical protein